MKRPRDKSFMHDPRTPAFMALFGVFFFWAAYHSLESRKITPGRILYALMLVWVALFSIAPFLIQVALFVKKRKERIAVKTAKANDA